MFIPDDCLHLIFSYHDDIGELFKYGSVCSDWYKAQRRNTDIHLQGNGLTKEMARIWFTGHDCLNSLRIENIGSRIDQETIQLVLDKKTISHIELERSTLCKKLVIPSGSKIKSLSLVRFENLHCLEVGEPSLSKGLQLQTLKIESCLQCRIDCSIFQSSAETLEVLSFKGQVFINDDDVNDFLPFLTNLKSLNIQNTEVKNLGVKWISENLKNLQEFIVGQKYLQDIGVQEITKELSKLQTLDVAFSQQLTFKSLQHVSTTKIRNLNLAGCMNVFLESRSLDVLYTCKSLISLNLSFIPVDRELRSIVESLPHLSTLILKFCRNFSDFSFQDVLRHGSQLRVLDISHCTKLSGVALQDVIKHRKDSLFKLIIVGNKRMISQTETRHLLKSKFPDLVVICK